MAMLNGDLELPKYGAMSLEQVLDAQAHLWNHIFSFINSMSLKCAIQLNIPDVMYSHGSPMSVSQLVDALSINKAKTQCLHRLMRLLVHSKFFVKVDICNNLKEEDEEHYWLTTTSRLLLRDSPFTFVPYSLLISDPILIKPWHHVSEWLINGKHGTTPFEIAHGRTIWKHMEQCSRLGDLFNEAMSCDTRIVMSILLKDYKHMFEGVELMVDVGGGVGTTAKALVDALPDMKCIVLELPHVVVGLEGTNNLTFVGGDMFLSVPQADIVLLKWILHDWSDEDCMKILEKCKEAILGSKNGGGKVMIIDMVLDDNCQGGVCDDNDKVTKEAQVLFDMTMMTYVNGKERSKREWTNLFIDANFTSYKFSSILGVRSIIEVYP